MNISELISRLIVCSTNEILDQISDRLNQISDLNEFIGTYFHSLISVEHWAWEILSRDTRQWSDDEQSYVQLFHQLSLFNHRVISSENELEIKRVLLLPESENILEGIFQQIERRADENDRFLSMIIQWIEGLAYLAHEHLEITGNRIVIYLNEHLFSDIFMREFFQDYLVHLRDSSRLITIKEQFYMKTSLFSLSEYFSSKPDNYLYNGQQILEYFHEDYINLILIHSLTVSSWTAELLECITHLIGVISACFWWMGIDRRHLETLINPNQRFYNYLHSLIDIFNGLSIDEPRHGILVENLVELIRYFLHFHEIKFYIRQHKMFVERLTNCHPTRNDRLLFHIYRLQSELFEEKELKQLHIAKNINEIFFDYLEKASVNPSKIYRKISMEELLKSFYNLACNDILKDAIIDGNELTFLLELTDDYPMIYNILWSLSFDIRIREQLRLDPNFIEKLNQSSSNEQIQRILQGIQWNLNLQLVSQTSKMTDEKRFDVLISYSQKDKLICTQIANELLENGFLVTLEFYPKHGNFIDSIVQTIDHSRSVVICVSERYKRSSLCRLAAQYAFKQRVKLIPILIDKYYKPDGWLSFLLGNSIPIDFIEKKYSQAMNLLLNQLKHPSFSVLDSLVVRQQPQNITNFPLPQLRSSDIRQWSRVDVQQWLNDNQLPHLAKLLSNINGLELIELSKVIAKHSPQENLNLFQEQSMKRTGRNVSLIEIARLHHLIEEQMHVHMPVKEKKWNLKNCCRMM